jgi:hypothetical protein
MEGDGLQGLLATKKPLLSQDRCHFQMSEASWRSAFISGHVVLHVGTVLHQEKKTRLP